MLNIVMPIAGRGTRFMQESYKNPKPFVEVDGVPMVQRVLDNIQVPKEAKLIIICLEELFDKRGEELEKICNNSSEQHLIIKIPEVTEGAACTILKAESLIDNDEELVIMNCDQLVLQPNFFQNSLDFYRRFKADGGIWCFYNCYPKWSYVNLDKQGKVIYVAEKQVISNFATVGIYYYRRGCDFVKNAKYMIEENRRVNNEFYVAPVFNYMIEKYEARILPFLVNEMYGIGTPEDLRIYQAKEARTYWG